MPISHDYKTIFVHIPKTGGSSIEATLGVYGADNHGDNSIERTDLLFGSHLQHLTAAEIAARSPCAFREYFKFSFVRNPWERAVSDYQWRRAWDDRARDRDFDSYVREVVLPNPLGSHFRPQHDYLCDRDGRLLVDFVGRFERLQEDFARVAAMIGSATALPHLCKSDHRPYRDHYSQRLRNIIAERFAADITRFGYAF